MVENRDKQVCNPFDHKSYVWSELYVVCLSGCLGESGGGDCGDNSCVSICRSKWNAKKKSLWLYILKVVMINDEINVADILYYDDRNDWTHTDVLHI